jgi:hypothetical protein
VNSTAGGGARLDGGRGRSGPGGGSGIRNGRKQERRRSGLVHLAAMASAIVSCSAFVVGGLMAGASGLNAVLLAAAVPAGGLVWAIALARLHRHDLVPGPDARSDAPDAKL